MREEGSEDDEGSNRDAPAKLPRLRSRPTWLAAHRVELSVYYRRLQREEYLTLGAIREGVPLSEAIEAGFQDSRAPASRRPRLVGEWFSHWAELGWICAPDLESLMKD
jgi:hypothetical protein